MPAASEQPRTLATMFPGIKGRMELVKVMLQLRMPELLEMSREEPLHEDLAQRLETARELLTQG